MAKFVVVKEAPTELKKGEYLIDTPSFIPQIEFHKAKKPRSGLTERMYLDAIMNSIGEAYDAGNTNPHSNRVKYHLYTGIKASLDSEVNDIILRAIRSDCSHLLAKYLEEKVRSRPTGTDKVIYVDSNIEGQFDIFTRNGLSQETAEVPQENKHHGKHKEKTEAKKNQADS